MEELLRFLDRVPAVRRVSHSEAGAETWWVKFALDIADPLAWRVVQELGYVLNYLSVEEPLPTVFKPVSPPPYMNGGADQFLSWVIEPTADAMTPELTAKWLEARLPRPVEDRAAWRLSDERG